ncbi:hypothetical protein JG687_00011619 [Phytophthora cactorum]|uniref:P-loop containing nucleoside triphosphate hydrolase n=2 Tax=Phytophthora cactorum TaxID=29920 RepID=A0A8T1U6K1_9STRA|nr:hypothetical protein JG687_00011619 [Phytophthora cactorum]
MGNEVSRPADLSPQSSGAVPPRSPYTPTGGSSRRAQSFSTRSPSPSPAASNAPPPQRRTSSSSSLGSNPSSTPRSNPKKERTIQRMDKAIRRRVRGGITYNMKLLVRGAKGTGKTSLFQRLKGEPIPDTHQSTPQLQSATIKWSFRQHLEENVKCEVWDVVDKGFVPSLHQYFGIPFLQLKLATIRQQMRIVEGEFTHLKHDVQATISEQRYADYVEHIKATGSDIRTDGADDDVSVVGKENSAGTPPKASTEVAAVVTEASEAPQQRQEVAQSQDMEDLPARTNSVVIQAAPRLKFEHKESVASLPDDIPEDEASKDEDGPALSQEQSSKTPVTSNASSTRPRKASVEEVMHLEDFQVPKVRVSDLDHFYSESESDEDVGEDDEVVVVAPVDRSMGGVSHKQRFIDSDSSDSDEVESAGSGGEVKQETSSSEEPGLPGTEVVVESISPRVQESLSISTKHEISKSPVASTRASSEDETEDADVIDSVTTHTAINKELDASILPVKGGTPAIEDDANSEPEDVDRVPTTDRDSNLIEKESEGASADGDMDGLDDVAASSNELNAFLADDDSDGGDDDDNALAAPQENVVKAEEPVVSKALLPDVLTNFSAFIRFRSVSTNAALRLSDLQTSPSKALASKAIVPDFATVVPSNDLEDFLNESDSDSENAPPTYAEPQSSRQGSRSAMVESSEDDDEEDLDRFESYSISKKNRSERRRQQKEDLRQLNAALDLDNDPFAPSMSAVAVSDSSFGSSDVMEAIRKAQEEAMRMLPTDHAPADDADSASSKKKHRHKHKKEQKHKKRDGEGSSKDKSKKSSRNMHMLFQSEAAYRRRRSWMPRDGDEAAATTTVLTGRPSNSVRMNGPRRRGTSRSCKTSRRDAKATKHRAQRLLKSEPEVEQDSDEEADNQDEVEQEASVALQDEVLVMQMEIETLQRQRLLLDSAVVNARTNAVTHAIDLTKGFYVHFSNGYDPVSYPEQSRQAETFLRGIMRKDAICTEFQGVDLFLNQYKMATQGHGSMRVFVHDIIVINEDLSSKDSSIQILAKATARFRVSRTTLEKFFPRIIDDEELAQQLIGKEYAIQYDKVFHFKHGRIFQHESQVDFCNSMLEMAQNPFVAMKLLEASLMTKHGHLKLDSNIEEDMNQLENTAL